MEREIKGVSMLYQPASCSFPPVASGMQKPPSPPPFRSQTTKFALAGYTSVGAA